MVAYVRGGLGPSFTRCRTCSDAPCSTYRGADKSLVRPGRKQANVSIRMA